MSAIDPVSSSTAATTAAAAASATLGTSNEQQDRFLKLLVTQLKNQDPLNPMDNAEMTTQMAQMSQLQGIEKLNATLESLATSLNASQAVQAASLVGHEVMASGNKIQLAGGTARAGVDLAQAADSLQVSIIDGSGKVIDTVDLGAQPQGVVQLLWDGTTDSGATAVDGSYAFSVNATAKGTQVSADPLMVGHVFGVATGKNGATLDMGTLGKVSLAQVKQFL